MKEIQDSYREKFGKEISFEDIYEIINIGQIKFTSLCIENKIDVTICVGKFSKYTYEKLITNNKETYYFKNNNELINNLNSILKEKDTILIKGSQGMRMERAVEAILEDQAHKSTLLVRQDAEWLKKA